MNIPEDLHALEQSIREAAQAGDKSTVLKKLSHLAEVGNAFSVPAAFFLLESDDREIRQKAAETVRDLMSEVAYEQWRDLESSCRYLNVPGQLRDPETYWVKGFYLTQAEIFGKKGEQKPSMPNLDALQGFDPTIDVHLLGIASLNRDGYVRQEAVRRLGKSRHLHAMPYLLLRLNDWVQQVHETAVEAFNELLPHLWVLPLAKQSRLIRDLERVQRRDHSAILLGIRNLVRSKISPYGIDLERLDRARDRQWLVEQLLDENTMKQPGHVRWVLRDSSPEVRECLAYRLFEHPNPPELLKSLMKDRTARVRYASIKQVIGHDYAPFEGVLRDALFDAHSGVRAIAQFALKKLGVEDFHSIYKGKYLKEKGKWFYLSKGELMGYIETLPTIECKREIERWASYDNRRVRLAVLKKLDALGWKDAGEHFVRALSDASPRVRKFAVETLSEKYFDVRPTLQDLLQQGPLPAQKAALKVLVSGVPSLMTLKELVAGLDHPNKEIRTYALALSKQWGPPAAISSWAVEEFKRDVEWLKGVMEKCSYLETRGFLKRAIGRLEVLLCYNA